MPLYGVQVSSGLPDCVLQSIVDNATVANEEYLCKLRVGDEHIEKIIRVIADSSY